MKNIKWKYKAKVNTYEGTIKGDKEPLIFIGGGLSLRKNIDFKNKNFMLLT